MKSRFIIFLLSFLAISQSSTAQTFDGSGFRFGYGYGMYMYHLSGPEIYCARANAIEGDTSVYFIEMKDRFGSLQNFHSVTISSEIETDKPVSVEIGWTMRRKSTSLEYVYETTPGAGAITYEEKVKLSTNTGFMTVGFRPKGGRLKLGVGGDLGFLRTKRKYTDASGKMGEWEPWFFSFGVTNKVKAFTPIAGYSLSVSYDFSIFTLRLSHLRPLLDGGMSSQTGKYTNIPWSDKRFPITSTTLSLLIHFKRG